jgi:hypothetical protein
MADGNLLEQIREQLATPWDWVFAGIGAAAGLGLASSVPITTIDLTSIDAGTRAAFGAIIGITARKTATTAFRGRSLVNKARNLLDMLEEHLNLKYQSSPYPPNVSPSPDWEKLISDLKRDSTLHARGLKSHDEFDSLLTQHIESYRKLT